MEVMRVLRDLGLLSDLETAKFALSKSLKPGTSDFSITVVEARGGEVNGNKAIVRFESVDYAQGGFTSMARLTGFTAAIVADLVARGEVRGGEGLIPIEEAYMANRNLLSHVINALRKENIKIYRTKTTIE